MTNQHPNLLELNSIAGYCPEAQSKQNITNYALLNKNKIVCNLFFVSQCDGDLMFRFSTNQLCYTQK